MTTFARITPQLSETLRELSPCASRLYEWLLQKSPAGRPQDLFLEDFAQYYRYSLKHVRRSLSRLLSSGIVEEVRRYSGLVVKLIAYDDRTFHLAVCDLATENATPGFSNGTESSVNDPGMSLESAGMSQIEHSNPHSVVTNNRESFEENRDTLPLHPVKGDKPKRDLVASEIPEGKAVLEPSTLHADLRELLQQPLNKNILAALLEYPETRARDALDALREAIATGNVKNPAGWFINALRKGFKPNHTRSSQSSTAPESAPATTSSEVPDGFNAWFELALKAGVALASDAQGDELMIYGPDVAEPYEQARQTWPLERLREMVKALTTTVAPTKVSEPPQGAAEPQGIDDPLQRQTALARLRAKFELPLLRKEAIAEAHRWGFRVTEVGIFEVAF